MHASTQELSQAVRATSGLEPRLRMLQGSYAGELCVVVTCGPSLSAIDSAALAHALDGVLTIAVKQAIAVVGGQADFHCWNAFNVARWPGDASETIRCFVSEPTGEIRQFNRADLAFPMQDGRGDLSRSLAWSKDFDRHTLTAGPLRPFGPGIMYELVFYLAVHLGVSEIITIGWDVASESGRNTHFYDSSEESAYFEAGRSMASPRQSHFAAVRQMVPPPVRRVVRSARAYREHRAGRTYNRNAALRGEANLVADSTGALGAWLAGRGVALRVASDSSFLSPALMRVDPAGALELVESSRRKGRAAGRSPRPRSGNADRS